jgi:aspartyl-tRNA synthetase
MTVGDLPRVHVDQLAGCVGSDVVVCGFVDTLRLQKAMQFVVIRDTTGLVQVVHRRNDDAELAERLDTLTAESAVIVTGTVVADDRVKLGGLELRLAGVEVVGRAESPLPIDDRSTAELRLDHPWLAWRPHDRQLVLQVQTTLLHTMRGFWVDRGMIELHSPKLMGSPSESGAEVFALDYFDRRAFLAQSPQFYKQLAMAAGVEGVFEVGPAFRAEPSHTSRHVTEFTSIDVELPWIESHEDVMQHEEQLLAEAVAAVTERHGRPLEALGRSLQVPSTPFPRLTIDQARAMLVSDTDWRPSPTDDGTLDPAGERALSQLVQRTLGHDFVFVTDYPTTARPFYHRRHDDRPTATRSFDLLHRGLEITTGAQREHRHERLTEQARSAGLDLSLLASYLDSFEHGCPPHGGFGLGLERLSIAMLRLPSIRDATFLPRTPTRLSP